MSDLGPRPFRLRVLWLLLGATFLTALLSLTGDVLGYDDVGLLYGSAGGRGALDRSAGSFFTTELFYYAWLPFYGLSYWLDGVLGAGRDATLLFHLQNLLWHAATSYLVFCVLAILLRHRVAALLGALLFAVHPLHVESVAWIAGRKEVMSGCFLFLAWLLALRAEARPGFLAAALAAFLVACFTKASAVVLPFLLLAAALLLPRYRNRRRPAALQTLPFFGLALVPTIVHLAVGVHQGVVAEARPLGARLLGWIAAWGASVYRTLLPFDLSLDYPETRVQGVGEVVLPGAAGRRSPPSASSPSSPRCCPSTTSSPPRRRSRPTAISTSRSSVRRRWRRGASRRGAAVRSRSRPSVSSSEGSACGVRRGSSPTRSCGRAPSPRATSRRWPGSTGARRG
ncbi:MAG: hypothetical protein ACYTFD_09840 [Planctomycetota bacterium]|jgi:hypothetical protein